MITQREIIRKYCYERDLNAKRLLDAVNEDLGPLTYRTQVIYNWLSGERPMRARLEYVMQRYPADDWRHKFASELMGARAEGQSI